MIGALMLLKEGIVSAMSTLEKGVVDAPDEEENESWRGQCSVSRREVHWSVNRLKKSRTCKRNQKVY